MTNKTEAQIFADDRPSSLDDDLYQWSLDAEIMLRAQAYRIAQLEAQLADRSSCLGVGDGSGSLFVYGNYESIKAAQDKIFRSEKLSALEAELIKQTNRAASAEQQLTAMTQRWEMANALNTEARAQLAQRQVPDGWVMVPKEPTLLMQTNALSHVTRQHQTRDIYRAMLAALEGVNDSQVET